MIYRVHPDIAHYKSFVIDSKEARKKLGSETMFHFSRAPQAYGDNWQPLDIGFDSLSSSKKAGMPDIMVRNGRLYLNAVAYEALSDLLKNDGEFLSVTGNGVSGYLFNILSLADTVEGLDNKLSTKNEYGEVQSLAFHADKLKDMTLFRTEFDSFLGVYCSETFKSTVETAELKGVVFSEDLGTIFPPDDEANSPLVQ